MDDALIISCFYILFHSKWVDGRMAWQNGNDSESICDGEKFLAHQADDSLDDFEEENRKSLMVL